MKVFVKDFCETVQARVVIFGMQVDNDILYGGIVNQPSHVYSSLYLSIFFLSVLLIMIFCKDFSETVQAGVVIICMQNDNDVLYCGIAIQLFHAYSSQYLSNFLSFHTLNHEIFRQRFL